MALVARFLPLVPLVLLSAPAGAATYVVDRFDDLPAADGCLLLVAGELFLDGFEGGTWWGWSTSVP